jgi:hypothetical protein
MNGWPVIPINGFNLLIDAYGVRILGTRPNLMQSDQFIPAVEVALSPLLAKVLAIKLRKTILHHEDEHGAITMNAELAKKEGISLDDDWETWRPTIDPDDKKK